MPHVLKPAFEQRLHELMGSRKPMRERELQPLSNNVTALLESIPEMLVEKTKRPAHRALMVEITATWVGAAASHKEVMLTLRGAWPGEALAGLEEMHTVENVEESALLRFLAWNETHYAVGRIVTRVL